MYTLLVYKNQHGSTRNDLVSSFDSLSSDMQELSLFVTVDFLRYRLLPCTSTFFTKKYGAPLLIDVQGVSLMEAVICTIIFTYYKYK